MDSSGTTEYFYDPMGNLTGANLPGTPGNKIRYVLDGEGRRVGKKVNDVMTERYLYRDRYRLAAIQGG